MASSAAIMAQIQAKKAEKEQLQAYLNSVKSVESEASCLTNSFGSASASMNEIGTIGGVALDFGKTEKVANQMSKITAYLGGCINDINGQIAEIDAEIAELYAAYYAALAEEEARRRRARENYAAKYWKNKKNLTK